MILGLLADARVSLARLAKFLAADDFQSQPSPPHHLPSSSGGSSSSSSSPLRNGTVVLGAGAFYWSEPTPPTTTPNHGNGKGGIFGGFETPPALVVDQPLVLRPGTLACVVGPVGVGKTAALLAVLGQLQHHALPLAPQAPLPQDALPQAPQAPQAPLEEQHHLSPLAADESSEAAVVEPPAPALTPPPLMTSTTGSVAYCAQAAWLPSTTIKGAVTFGRPFEGPWYAAVLKACQLDKDLALLPGGDATEVKRAR